MSGPLMPPTHDSLLAKLARILAPHYGWCSRCGIPWKFTAPHSVNYDLANGVFTLCETCWLSLTPTDRIPYHWVIVNIDWLQPDLWPDVERAILEGELTLDDDLRVYRSAP